MSCPISARAYDPFPEQVEQLGAATLLDQQGADHGKAWAALKRSLGLNDHLDNASARVARLADEWATNGEDISRVTGPDAPATRCTWSYFTRALPHPRPCIMVTYKLL